MKILHLIYDHINNPWVGGGGAVRVYEICKRLSAGGHEVTVLSGRFPGARDYQEQGLCYKFVGNEKNYILSTFSYAFKAARFVKKYGDQFDIIVEDFAPWNPVFSSFLTKRPVVLHVNHKEGWNIIKRRSIPGIPFFLIEVFYPRFFHNITALSAETRRKINRSDAVIVPPGIDSALLDGLAPSGDSDAEDNYILYIGRLHIRNKGLDTLLYAMRGIDSKLLLIGKGKDEDMLKKMARELALKNLEFLGFIREDEKIKLLRKTKLFVLPSRFEGWGIVVLEAAACGIPVVVSDIPELHYAVEAGFGQSFRTGDSGDLAGKIQNLIENTELRREMGLKARLYAQQFTWDSIATTYEKFLLKVAAEQRR